MKQHRQLAMLALVAVALAGCDSGPPPQAYARFSDKLKAASGNLLGYPCTKTVKDRGVKVHIGSPSTECYRFGSAERISGIWLYEFEASHFLEGQMEPPKAWAWTNKTISLEYGRPDSEKYTKISRAVPRRAYQIDFIGRRMMYPFEYPSGATETIVAVDRIIKIREVKAPTETLWCKTECVPFRQAMDQMLAEARSSRDAAGQ